MASAQGCSLILTTGVTCNNCAGRRAKAGCSCAGHPGCSCQHSPSPFPQAQASTYCCPGHTQACTPPCDVHASPPSALRSINPVGRHHTRVSCYCSCGCNKCSVTAAHHSYSCICFEMLPHVLSRMKPHRGSRQSVITLQVPSQARDKEIVNAAKNIMFSSAQKLQLTELSGRRDMSLLLAQSAVQVGVMHIQLEPIHALCVLSGCA
jgi:hypothetical protein